MATIACLNDRVVCDTHAGDAFIIWSCPSCGREFESDGAGMVHQETEHDGVTNRLPRRLLNLDPFPPDIIHFVGKPSEKVLAQHENAARIRGDKILR